VSFASAHHWKVSSFSSIFPFLNLSRKEDEAIISNKVFISKKFTFTHHLQIIDLEKS